MPGRSPWTDRVGNKDALCFTRGVGAMFRLGGGGFPRLFGLNVHGRGRQVVKPALDGGVVRCGSTNEIVATFEHVGAIRQTIHLAPESVRTDGSDALAERFAIGTTFARASRTRDNTIRNLRHGRRGLQGIHPAAKGVLVGVFQGAHNVGGAMSNAGVHRSKLPVCIDAETLNTLAISLAVGFGRAAAPTAARGGVERSFFNRDDLPTACRGKRRQKRSGERKGAKKKGESAKVHAVTMLSQGLSQRSPGERWGKPTSFWKEWRLFFRALSGQRWWLYPAKQR